MPESSYELDPDGDIILVLQNPDKPFAVWDDEVWPIDTEPSNVQKMRPNYDRAGEPVASFCNVDPAWDEPIFEPTIDTDDLVPAPQDDAPSVPSIEVEAVAPEPVEEDSVAEIVPDVRMRLSSRHLTLASAWFRAELDGPYSNSATSPTAARPDAPRTVQAYDWDVEALLALMNIIHGHNRSVPRSVSLEFLAKFAVLVDYYQCHEVVELFSEMWVSQIESEQHNEQSERDIWLQIMVSGIFSHSRMFKSVTRSAIMLSRGQRYTLQVPCPSGLPEKIEDQRQSAISRIVSLIHDLLEYLITRTACTRSCSDTLLGTLTRQIQAHGLLYPTLTKPFYGHSVSNVLKKVQGLLSTPEPEPRSKKYRQHACALYYFLAPKLSELESSIEGLDLEDFKRPEPIIDSCNR